METVTIMRLVLGIMLMCACEINSKKQPVNIGKCCKINESLTSDRQCLKNESSSWDLRIFNGKTHDFTMYQKLPPHWNILEAVPVQCSKPILVTLSSKSTFPFLNGSLYSLEYDKFFHPHQYCLDYNTALICLDFPENLTQVTVKKCCGTNAIFSAIDNSCKAFWDYNGTFSFDLGSDFIQIAGFPECKNNKLTVVSELEKSELLSNGSILVDGKFLVEPGKFCLEYVLGHRARLASILTCSDHGHLGPTRTRVETDLRHTLYPIGLALSAIFLAATFAAGSLLPASHHVLHWRCQTNHVACLFVGDVLLCITNLSGKIEYGPCFGIAVIMHFVFLAAFFWLNTMCFNIWWTFRDLRPQSTEKSQERLRLRLYEAYAWGIPFIIALIAACLDLNNNPQYEILRPRFAESNCWFYGDVEKLTFFFGPIGTLLLINLILFGLTARELTCGLWKRELVKSTTERAALGRVCMKLVVVMGVSWILDLISFAVGGPHEIWYVTDFINSLHGVFIFIVVGCQPQVLSAVKRFWCMRKHQNGTAGTTHHHSTSSQGPPSMGDTLTNTTTVIANGKEKTAPMETTC